MCRRTETPWRRPFQLDALNVAVKGKIEIQARLLPIADDIQPGGELIVYRANHCVVLNLSEIILPKQRQILAGMFEPGWKRIAADDGSTKWTRLHGPHADTSATPWEVSRFAFVRELAFTAPMRIEIINTGTELMLGNVLNSHLGFISSAIFPLRVQRQATVPDGDAIRHALLETFGRADIVFVTGGLGPTTDDITREIVCELLGLTLQHDEEIWQAIMARFIRRGIPWNDRVKLQALHPPEAHVLPNPNGTAPGLYFPPIAAHKSPHLFLLPGPPRELHPMVKDAVLPILARIAPSGPAHELRTFRTTGLGESRVEDMVGEALIALGLEVGYCARPGEVDLRLIGTREVLDAGEAIVREKLGAAVFTTDSCSLEQSVVTALIAKKTTLAVAESCTGGWISNKLTNVPGASAVFLAGYVTYANEAKTRTLGVPAELIAAHGAVSAPVAKAMAEGARTANNADLAISTTGIAGPGGGGAEKPVGTVFIALAQRDAETLVVQHNFPTDRETFKHLVAQTALDLIRRRVS